MSLHLAYATPNLTVKSVFGQIGVAIHEGKSFSYIPYGEFAQLIEYYFENEDILGPDDPRLILIEKIKTAEIVKGFNNGSKRIKIGQVAVQPYKPKLIKEGLIRKGGTNSPPTHPPPPPPPAMRPLK